MLNMDRFALPDTLPGDAFYSNQAERQEYWQDQYNSAKRRLDLLEEQADDVREEMKEIAMWAAQEGLKVD